MKKLLVICSLVWTATAFAEESCLEQKLQVQNLLKQNAQLMFSSASQEAQRLEALKKAEEEAKKASNGSTPPAADTNFGEPQRTQ